MGLWWKNISKKEADFSKKISYGDDARSWSKRTPLLWRVMQTWRIIKVNDYHAGYVVCRKDSPHQVERFRKVLNTPYVAVQVGAVPVTFGILDARGQALEIDDVGVSDFYTNLGGLMIDGRSIDSLIADGAISWTMS